MKKYLLLAYLAFATLANAQVKETRSISRPNGIKTSTNIHVKLVSSNRNEVVVEGDSKNVVSKIETVNDGGILVVRLKRNSQLQNVKVMRVTVYTNPNIRYAAASSNGKIELPESINVSEIELNASSNGSIITSTINANSVELNASSNGRIETSVKSEEIEADASSNGKINVSGAAKKLSLEATSNAVLDLRNVNAQNVSAEASSNGSVLVQAHRTLSADVSSGGKVRYAGNPTDNKFNKSSGGTVSKL